MMQNVKSRTFAWIAGAAAVVAAGAMFAVAGHAQSKEPIKIGFSMAQTGPLGAERQAGAARHEDLGRGNQRQGRAARPSGQARLPTTTSPTPRPFPASTPSCSTSTKSTWCVSGYATNMVAPAMPIVIQKKKTFISLFALDVNAQFKYPKYFSVLPTGPKTKPSFTEGFFQVADAAEPEADRRSRWPTRTPNSRKTPARARVRTPRPSGFKIVYDKSFPPDTTDFSPIVRAVQAANPDLVVVCSYPLGSVGMVQAVNEANYKPKMIGGAMVGLQATVFKNKLGPKLNGIVNYETWVPSDKMMAPAAGLLQEIPGARQGRGRRSARLLSRRLGLCLYQHAGRSGRRDQERQRRQDRRLAAQDHPSRPSWATGATARTASGPSRGMMQVQYHGIKEGAGLDDLERHELPDRADAGSSWRPAR